MKLQGVPWGLGAGLYPEDTSDPMCQSHTHTLEEPQSPGFNAAL